MSEKALQREVSEADHRRLLDESIAELTTTANKA
jgi:F0F1-type ATP synthase membrane subunit b/b'